MTKISTSKKDKILFILHTPPPVHGAAMVGKYIKDSSLINNSFETKFINLGTSKSLDDIGKGGFQKLFRFFELLWKVIVQMVTFRPDKVYLTLTAKGCGFYKDAVVVFLAKILGGRMIYHFHNKGVQKRQHRLFDDWLYNKIFKNADVILLSEHLYSDVKKYVPREQVHICPNGIPEELIPKSGKDGNSEQKPVRLLFLSNLIETKGIFVLLEACKILKKKGLSFCCTYVGGEGDITASELSQRIAELGLKKEVTYVGKKYGEEKEKVFSESNVFVLPTYYTNECFPLVLLEAMQAELAIVTTPEGGIPSMIQEGKNGFLVSQKDAQALAIKLEELIKDPEKRKKMGRKGYQKYRKNFTLEVFEKRFSKILLKLIKS